MYARIRLFVIVVGVAMMLSGWCGLARAGSTVTQRVYEGAFNLAIPADPSTTMGWMDDAIVHVPDHITIEDLDVSVTLTHTSVFDLQLILRDPSGKSIVLNAYDSPEEFFLGQDYNQTVFDDEALLSIQEGTAPFTGSFRPVDSLSIYDGKDAYGPWCLSIYDMSYGDTGSLQSFGLVFNVPNVPEPSTIALTISGLGSVGFWIRRRWSSRTSLGLFS